MIDPQKCVKEILRNAPSELAVPLFDLMVWMADQPDLKESESYSEALELAYSKTDRSHDARETYAKERLGRAELREVKSVAVT